MSKSHTRRTRRHRRGERAVLKYGPRAKRRHTRKSGRTGRIWSKRTRSKKQDEKTMLEENEKRAVVLDRLHQATLLILSARGDTKITPKLRDSFDSLLNDLGDLREYLEQEKRQ